MKRNNKSKIVLIYIDTILDLFGKNNTKSIAKSNVLLITNHTLFLGIFSTKLARNFHILLQNKSIVFCLGTVHLVVFIIFHDGFDFLQVKPKSKITYYLPFLNHKFIPILKK